jgi:hypothetical protein
VALQLHLLALLRHGLGLFIEPGGLSAASPHPPTKAASAKPAVAQPGTSTPVREAHEPTA